jgi:hypothetical protein
LYVDIDPDGDEIFVQRSNYSGIFEGNVCHSIPLENAALCNNPNDKAVKTKEISTMFLIFIYFFSQPSSDIWHNPIRNSSIYSDELQIWRLLSQGNVKVNSSWFRQKRFFSGYSIKIPNPNTQNPNNIQIRKTNFRNIPLGLLIFYDKLDCFEFWISVIGIWLSPPWCDWIGSNYHPWRNFR